MRPYRLSRVSCIKGPREEFENPAKPGPEERRNKKKAQRTNPETRTAFRKAPGNNIKAIAAASTAEPAKSLGIGKVGTSQNPVTSAPTQLPNVPTIEKTPTVLPNISGEGAESRMDKGGTVESRTNEGKYRKNPAQSAPQAGPQAEVQPITQCRNGMMQVNEMETAIQRSTKVFGFGQRSAKAPPAPAPNAMANNVMVKRDAQTSKPEPKAGAIQRAPANSIIKTIAPAKKHENK
jgi:hypothetical protein